MAPSKNLCQPTGFAMTTKQSSSKEDDSYASAAKAVTDEAMRIDNLAPNILNAIENDVKLRNGIKDIVVETISEKDGAKTAINTVVSNNDAVKKSNAAWKQPSFWIPIVIASLLSIASMVITIIIAINNGQRE